MTATQPDTISRRGVMRATAVGIGAAGSGAIGARYGTGSVAAIPPLALVPAAAAVGVLAYGEFIAGPDDSEVADALDWESHVQEFTRAREDQLALEQTFASLERDVQLVENKAREEAIFRIYEQGVDSGSESDATAAAETAINEAYATVERAILNSWSIRANRAENVVNNLGSGIMEIGTTTSQPDNSDGLDSLSASFEETTVTDLAGNSISYTRCYGRYGVGSGPDFYNSYTYDPWPSTYENNLNDAGSDGGFYNLLEILEPDPADYDSVDEGLDVSYPRSTLMDSAEWYDLLVQLHDAHSTVIGEVSSMVDSYFTPAQNGEIDLNNALGPSYLADSASNAQDFEEAALAMRSLGYPISDQALVFSFDDSPDTTIDARLAWTAHNGNTLSVGETIEPSNTVGSIFAAANVEKENGDQTGKTFEISKPFTILEADDGSTQISFEDRSLAESDTSAEEIEQIFKENYDANERATEIVYETATDDDGGGGGGAGAGWFEDGPNTGAIAAVVGGIGVVYALFGQGDS